MTNSRLTRKFISVALAFALVFSSCMPAMATPGTGGIASIKDFSGGQGGTSGVTANTIYFGKYSNSAIQWRVLSNDTTGTGTKQIMLFSDRILYDQKFNNSVNDGNIWGDDSTGASSAIRTQMNGTGDGQFLNSSNFGTAEVNAIAETTNTTLDERTSATYTTKDRVFLLTKEDVYSNWTSGDPNAYGFSDKNSRKSTGGSSNIFWLRSPSRGRRLQCVLRLQRRRRGQLLREQR